VAATPRQMVASWRNGYAEDCKSLHPGSIPGEASNLWCQVLPWRKALTSSAAVGKFRSMSDFAATRRNMVDTQLRTYDVNSKRLLDAVEAVGREHYVPASVVGLAYADQPLTVSTGEGETRSLLQPMVLARMIQSADIQAGEKALSVAGGTGYGAAVMTAMGASVTLLEASEALTALARRALLADGVDSVAVVTGDLTRVSELKKYDVILVEGAIESDPTGLLAALADGGRLVAVVGKGRAGRVAVFQRTGETVGSRNIFDASAASLGGFQSEPGFRF
jgi:protein-L-isoaspartate(D-aspartate) O-methyltransferase